MTAIQKFNPGIGFFGRPPEWELPPLPSESRLEIHHTNDPNLPFEFRLITVKELSAEDLKIRNLFVDVILENHTRTQNFEVWLSGPCIRVNTRMHGPIKAERIEVNRDHTTEARIRKTDVPSKTSELQQALEDASGCWETLAIVVQDCWSRFTAWFAGLFQSLCGR